MGKKKFVDRYANMVAGAFMSGSGRKKKAGKKKRR